MSEGKKWIRKKIKHSENSMTESKVCMCAFESMLSFRMCLHLYSYV